MLSVARVARVDTNVTPYSRVSIAAHGAADGRQAALRCGDASLRAVTKPVTSRECSANRVTQEDIELLMDSIAGGDTRRVGRRQTKWKRSSGTQTAASAEPTMEEGDGEGEGAGESGGRRPEPSTNRRTRRPSASDIGGTTPGSTHRQLPVHTAPRHRADKEDELTLPSVTCDDDKNGAAENQLGGQETKASTTACSATTADGCTPAPCGGVPVDPVDRSPVPVHAAADERLMLTKLRRLELNIVDNMSKLRELVSLRGGQPGGPAAGGAVLAAEERTIGRLRLALQQCLDRQAQLIDEFCPRHRPSAGATDTPVTITGTVGRARPLRGQLEEARAISDEGGAASKGETGVQSNRSERDALAIADASSNVGPRDTVKASACDTATECPNEKSPASNDDALPSERTASDGSDTSRLSVELFERLDTRVARLYREYNSAYWAWCELKGVRDMHARSGVRMPLTDRRELRSQRAVLASLHVDIERYARYLAAAARLFRQSDATPPLSTWQRAELAAVDAHVTALGATRSELVTRLNARRRRLLADVTLPRLPDDSPGNDSTDLMRMLRAHLKPVKRAYVQDKLATLMRDAQTDETEATSGDSAAS